MLRKRLRRQHLGRLERDHALDHVLQLTHVSRPVIFLDRAHGIGRNVLLRDAEVVAVLGDEVLDEKLDVLFALPQRRKLDRDHVDAVEEVLAECAFLNRVVEIAIRCGDHADLDLRLDVRSDFANDTVLQHAKQLDLHRQGGFADLIEEDRAAIGFGEQTTLLPDRAGERAAFVTEQFGLEQVFRKGAAVDRHEFAAPAGVVMKGPRDQLLACARLARDQHRRRRPGDALHDREDLLHLRALADDVRERETFFERGPEVKVFVLELFPLDSLADDDLQLFDVERLGDVVERACFQRVDRRLRRRVSRDHDESDGRVLRFHLANEVDSRSVGHHQVAQHELRLVLRD